MYFVKRCLPKSSLRELDSVKSDISHYIHTNVYTFTISAAINMGSLTP